MVCLMWIHALLKHILQSYLIVFANLLTFWCLLTFEKPTTVNQCDRTNCIIKSGTHTLKWNQGVSRFNLTNWVLLWSHEVLYGDLHQSMPLFFSSSDSTHLPRRGAFSISMLPEQNFVNQFWRWLSDNIHSS